MRCVGRELLVVAVIPLLVMAGSCSSSDEDPTVDPSLRGGNAAEGYPMERALVACIQDNGIDAELLPNGVVQSDKNGTLSREESRALSDLCYQRLEDEGFILYEEPDDESLERAYNAWVSSRECLIEEGIPMGELVSFETFAANPDAVAELLSTAIREHGIAFAEAYAECPWR